MKHLFFIAITLHTTLSFAGTDIDCNNPTNLQETRICQQNSLKETETQLKSDVAKISEKLTRSMGTDYANQFLQLQSDWENLTKRQCQHKRELSGKGSAGGIEYMTCKELLYNNRIRELKMLYLISQ